MELAAVKIVLLVTDLGLGGTPLRLAGLARGLKSRGIDVTVGCLADRGPVSDQLEAAGIPTFACRARHARDFGALLRLRGHLRRLRPDLIHSTLTHANVAARLIGGCLGIPVVSSTATIEIERKWHLRLERATARWDRGHIVNSQSLAEHVRIALRLPPERIHVVPLALERPPVLIDREAARAAMGVGRDEFLVAWAGRFDPVKGLDRIIDCARKLTGRAYRFALAGDGPLRAAIEPEARELGIDLMGWQPNLAPLLSAADVFLFPSRTEGTPNAVLAAMAAGVPVVGSDIPILRELAGPERRIRIVAGDEFSAAIEALRADPDERIRLSRVSREWAGEALRHDRMVEAVVEVYRATAVTNTI